MRVHSFTTNIVAWAAENYITIDKYKDNPNMNQFERIQAHYEMLRLKKIHKEFTKDELITDYEIPIEWEK